MMNDRLPGAVTQDGSSYRVRKWVEGRRVQRRFKTLDEALAFLRDLEGRIRVLRLRDIREGASTRVGDLVARWFANHRRRLQPGTQFDYEWRIRHDISKIADVDAHDLIRDPSILHDFYWNQLGPQSARNARTILLQAFEEGVMRKLIPENPARGQKLPSARSVDKDIPTPEEVAKMILAAEEEDGLWGLFVKITATLGTRRGETCALRWEDFDAGSQRVLLRRAACVSVDVLTVKAPKSGRSRTLHIPSDAFWRGLEEFRLPNGFLFRGWVRDPVRRRELESRGEDKCWHVYTASHRFGRMIRRLGLLSENGRPYGLHSLRHFVATQLYNQSKDWVQVAKFMGHRDPSITMKLYANHVVEAGQRELGALAAAPWWPS
ncbi:MAG TPA: site-specific integrase [Actinomycetota bacterium]|nr:site-specific integrase [Actinomycetota bacterium]